MKDGYIGSGAEPDELELAKIALHILSGYTPENREAARRRYVDLLEREFRESGLEPPEWIGRLREEPWDGETQRE
ncbi:MAG TPA: hypothetical protein VFT45_15665 [Longimicrobium sp.]|nr:hypothetical protein [Longimicrobium sp.]